MQLDKIMSRVLSIQSHVVHGYVGNKAAVSTVPYDGYELIRIPRDEVHTHMIYSLYDTFHMFMHAAHILDFPAYLQYTVTHYPTHLTPDTCHNPPIPGVPITTSGF